MKKLEVIAFDPVLCRRQVEEFRSWLAGKVELSEREDVLPFFRARPHLALLFAPFNFWSGRPDRIAWEFDVFGDFACDLVVGDWDRGAYCFVEFEDARSDSIFEKQGKKATREWGRRFEHGFSQILDWMHKLDGRTPSTDMLARFGRYEITYEAVLVIGRDQHLDEGEKERLKWRSDKLAVNTNRIFCLTFDNLLSQFSARLTFHSGRKTPVPGPTPGATPAPPRKPRRGKP
jgi:hypothetical protein